jgi:hypothetical protein
MMECALAAIFIIITVTAIAAVKRVFTKALRGGCTDCDRDYAESLRDMLG